ncbi:MAG TPA: Ldh family oxidoreductase [bacterium]|nr:Ldh family oxidoreductase [bacterium]
MDKIFWMPFAEAETFMVKVFEALGVREEEARICADVLITADKRGIDSHGVGRLKPIYYDRIRDSILNTETNIEIVREGPTTAVIDGHDGMGFVIAKKAMEMCIEKAGRFGMGMAAVRNSSHYGAACYYPLMAVKNGMIGVTGTNARPSMAPTFGVENMLGTNPLTFGIPTDEEFPFVIDCATSITQRGKIEVFSREGKGIPEGWVVGEDGNPRTDTDKILKDLVKGKAALTPLGGIGEETGGHKGYGYAVVVEILSAALQDGKFLKSLYGYDRNGKKIPYSLGHFFIAINVEFFIGLERFKKIAGDILRDLRNSKKVPGRDRIFTAGEKEYIAWNERKDRGVPLGRELRKQFVQMRDELKLDMKFGFESEQ